jgi:arylformamidase
VEKGGSILKNKERKRMKIFDITPIVDSNTPLFPGDTTYTHHILMDNKKGDPYFLSSIHTSVHIGAHADSFLHFHPEGKSIDEHDLTLYLGPAQVIDVSLPLGERIFPKDIENIKISAPRVLFKTNSFPAQGPWTNDFNSLSPDLISYLSEKEVVLVGIDTPSVDPATDKILSSHQMLYEKKIVNLEGLFLEEVPPGEYELIALPLRLKGVEASPVRAILRELKV